MTSDTDYLAVLRAVKELPFAIGKNLLIEYLQGQDKNESIRKNRLHQKPGFGSLAYDKDELGRLIDNLSLNGMLTSRTVGSNRFWKVLELTPKGRNELENPTMQKKSQFEFQKTEITDKDREIFGHFGDFLKQFNDEQKKAIISNHEKILCIAGAGSGKTAVLTKRIEFLINYRSISPDKILAITFTRKARQEMQHRLNRDGFFVAVETFNSFCEKILQKYNYLAYDKPVRVVSYRDRILMITKALARQKITMKSAIMLYFSPAQQHGKTEEQLANIFMNDCFFIRDYFKSKNKPVKIESFDVDASNRRSVELVFEICTYIEQYMAEEGLRDFADQLMDAMALFEKHPETIPKFEHILIDEYQDVNSTQIKLVDMLAPLNIFAVGDPRQSIYGWRGSDVRHMLRFSEKYPGCEILTLTKNYRSTKHIVNLINSSIKPMGFPDLEFTIDGERDIHLLKFDAELAEFEFVIQKIIDSKVPRSQIFVLARTNRQLNELSTALKSRNIPHVMRSDEIKQTVVAGEGEVTLATIHAIKGLEAEIVFVIGCTSINFPARGSEHPVIDMVKVEEYDKEEEEKRLFYVAMSRARRTLFLTYSSKKPTGFITEQMLAILGAKKTEETKLQIQPGNRSTEIAERLKEWRRKMSSFLGVPPYIILHDKTIIELSEQQPTTKEELETISGIGPMKIVKYGEDILKLISGGF